MGLAIYNQAEVLVPGCDFFSKEYERGPLVITPKKIYINQNYEYLAIQSCIVKDNSKNIPRLKFWYFDDLSFSGIIKREPEVKYEIDELTELGKNIAISLIGKIVYGLYKKDEKDLYWKLESLADCFVREHRTDYSLDIRDDIIINIVNEIKENNYNTNNISKIVNNTVK